MKSAAAEVMKTEDVPEIRSKPQPIGFEKNDYTVQLDDSIKPEHLVEPQCWTLAKHLSPSDGGPCLMPGDTVRCIHRDYFADVIIDHAGPGEPCYAIVRSVTPRQKREGGARVLVPSTHWVRLNVNTGMYDYGMYRGPDREEVQIGQERTDYQAAEKCILHASKTAKR